MLRTLGDERLVDVTILDCFWYHMYLNGSPKVMDWIKEKGIFSKTYTFVPIVDGGHWNLLILCNLGKSFNNNYSSYMILLDSLIISDPLKAEPTIRRFVKDLFHTQGKMASSRSIGSILLLLPKVPQQRDGKECGVFTHYYIYLFLKSAPATFSFTEYPYFMTTTWFSYLEIDAFKHKIRNFADLSLNDPHVMPCENVELEDESDNTIKRKYDIPNEDLYRGWVMKDLSFKWKFHKYDVRRKYLKQDKKGIQIKPPSRYHIHEDMWTEEVKVWTSSAFWKEKTGTDPDRADVFIITHTRKDGRPINKDCAIAIEKLKALKQTEPSTNPSNPVVAKDDAFSKVFGEEKSGRIRGVGTRPSPVTLWGRKNEVLKYENKTLHERIKVLEEKFAKLKNKEMEENESQVRRDSPGLFASSMASKECESSMDPLTGKNVKLLDLVNEQVAEGIVMSIDPNKIVMGRPIGHVYCEVSITYENRPDAPLFVKDDHRFRIKDAVLEVIFYGFEIMCWWMRQNDHYLVLDILQEENENLLDKVQKPTTFNVVKYMYFTYDSVVGNNFTNMYFTYDESLGKVVDIDMYL
ncbi:hypothetical protein Taro_019410 [Colocasia esculenta]|uniref:Ubiquitin-like protease family profile domain-containing protein n=1 Tax=Colocasia esculenta TaxID=4460 RepID=A0A843UW90_COLES|nr:hypothetical protein [Colocasia esculenta]